MGRSIFTNRTTVLFLLVVLYADPLASVKVFLPVVSCNAAVLASPQQKKKEDLAKYYKNLGEQSMDKGDFVKAKGFFEQAANLGAKDSEVYIGLGRCSYNTFDKFGSGLDEAIRHFKKGLEVEPNAVRCYNHLSEIYCIQGRYEDALKAAKDGSRVAPSDVSSYVCQAVALSNLKRYDQAIEAGNTAVKLDSNSLVARETRASLLEERKRYLEAAADYKVLLQKSKKDSYLYRYAFCLDKGGKGKDSIAILSTWLKDFPQDEQARLQRARLYVRFGMLAQAEHDYSAAILDAPTAAYYKERAEIYKRQGRLDLYRKDLKAAENN
ncbi:MAG: tetratricopeptide repeat protein [Candidatus Obscuribacter phosphatis]|uniref:Tetratricopeptide repeat protein n=1 Tax=Candidatus Obscuribacter phosphatis TaxID=1906157 RepID=A0A8J7PAE8_9BACT|nr:tetratricopeptide repeat protein [Candidatus Obscuribacter phosphatis]